MAGQKKKHGRGQNLRLFDIRNFMPMGYRMGCMQHRPGCKVPQGNLKTINLEQSKYRWK
jgi:hypothetical protein